MSSSFLRLTNTYLCTRSSLNPMRIIDLITDTYCCFHSFLRLQLSATYFMALSLTLIAIFSRVFVIMQKFIAKLNVPFVALSRNIMSEAKDHGVLAEYANLLGPLPATLSSLASTPPKKKTKQKPQKKNVKNTPGRNEDFGGTLFISLSSSDLM